MLAIYDTITLDAALSQPIAPEHAQILQSRWADAERLKIQNQTVLLLIQPGDELAEIEDEVGYRPTVNPIDGTRYGSPLFAPFWSWLADLGNCYEMIVTPGTDYATILLIEKADGVPRCLLQMCREYARCA